MTNEPDRIVELIESFRRAEDLQTVEKLADALAATGDERAIGPLLYRLPDHQVQEDADVEDAVCGALVKLGVMNELGNLIFRLRASEQLEPEARAAVAKYKAWIPWKYFPESETSQREAQRAT